MKRLKPIALWLGTLLVVAFVLLFFEADQLWKVQYHNVFLHSALYFKQILLSLGGCRRALWLVAAADVAYGAGFQHP